MLLTLGEFTDLDLRLADAMFDPAAHGFPWRHRWFAEVLLHHRLRQAMSILGVTLLVLVAIDAVRPAKWLAAEQRLRLRAVAATALAIPLSVSLLKAIAFSHCPWDLSRYGGWAPYVRLLEAAPPGVAAGHCFPAGHATSGLWLIAVSLLWTAKAPRKAVAVAACAVTAGLALGFLQQMRGAHFLSHTLWSAWLAIAIDCAAARWLQRQLAM